MMSFPADKFKLARIKDESFANVKARALKGCSYEQQNGNGKEQMTSLRGGDSRTYFDKYRSTIIIFSILTGGVLFVVIIYVLPFFLKKLLILSRT